ncbi:BON domain-containing protein [Chitinispirillales bacterium ANBcel5]|uniref:BON domain-containing protein n=1 Tax=Cellulosispirillum alkaliphilum TaxID=3039283 RepID=UPI002A55D6E4|nr:BON domain-containing protein [Chitinispirillales bacterium ANBcel5]
MNKTDEQLKEKILEQLSWDVRLEEAQIGAEVSKSRVRLYGWVTSLEQLMDAELSVFRVRGVKEVESDLKIKVAPSPDEQLKNFIEQTLTSHSEIDEREIVITVEDGVISIDGTVDALWKKDRVQSIVSSTSGVAVIINRLTVASSQKNDDKLIAQDIEQQFEKIPEIDPKETTVIVTDGVVELRGKVPFLPAWLHAEFLARHTKGVKDVINNLLIS